MFPRPTKHALQWWTWCHRTALRSQPQANNLAASQPQIKSLHQCSPLFSTLGDGEPPTNHTQNAGGGWEENLLTGPSCLQITGTRDLPSCQIFSTRWDLNLWNHNCDVQFMDRLRYCSRRRNEPWVCMLLASEERSVAHRQPASQRFTLSCSIAYGALSSPIAQGPNLPLVPHAKPALLTRDNGALCHQFCLRIFVLRLRECM